MWMLPLQFVLWEMKKHDRKVEKHYSVVVGAQTQYTGHWRGDRNRQFSQVFCIVAPPQGHFLDIFFLTNPHLHEMIIQLIYHMSVYVLWPCGGPQAMVMSKIFSPLKNQFLPTLKMQALGNHTFWLQIPAILLISSVTLWKIFNLCVPVFTL